MFSGGVGRGGSAKQKTQKKKQTPKQKAPPPKLKNCSLVRYLEIK